MSDLSSHFFFSPTYGIGWTIYPETVSMYSISDTTASSAL